MAKRSSRYSAAVSSPSVAVPTSHESRMGSGRTFQLRSSLRSLGSIANPLQLETEPLPCLAGVQRRGRRNRCARASARERRGMRERPPPQRVRRGSGGLFPRPRPVVRAPSPIRQVEDRPTRPQPRREARRPTRSVLPAPRRRAARGRTHRARARASCIPRPRPGRCAREGACRAGCVDAPLR